jgi:hypothetical protein
LVTQASFSQISTLCHFVRGTLWYEAHQLPGREPMLTASS